MNKLCTTVVHHALRMPLDGNDGQSCMHNALNYIVSGTAYDSKIAAKPVNCLVMGGIDECGSAV